MIVIPFCTIALISTDLTATEFKPALSIGAGNSSNVSKLIKGTSGAYYKLNPTFDLEYLAADSLVINLQAVAALRRYFDNKIGPLANENSEEVRSTLIWFVNEHFEFGGDIGILKSDSRSPVQISSGESIAEVQRFAGPDAYFYGAWVKDSYEVELGTTFKYRDYSTLLSDRGNAFENDSRTYGAILKLNYKLNNKIKVLLRTLLNEKKYLYRSADFTDGAASNSATPNPILKETSKDFSFGIEYVFDNLKLETTPGYRYQKDRIFGARDSKTWKIQQKISVAINKKVDVMPSFSISEERFVRFRSNPEVNPFGNEMRKDVDINIKTNLKYKFSENYACDFQYSFTRKSSNYANSSYSEHDIYGGISIKL